jgi:hypothetical protein
MIERKIYNNNVLRNIATATALSLAAVACSSGTEADSAPETSAVVTEVTEPTVVDSVDTNNLSSTAEKEIDEIDTSYWNLDEDRKEVLLVLARDYDFPVDAEEADLSPEVSKEEIVFSFMNAFAAARNTDSVMPMVKFSGADSLEEFNQNPDNDVSGIETFLFSNNFRKPSNDPEDVYGRFDVFVDGFEYITETFDDEGNRIITATEIPEYTFEVPTDYTSPLIEDPRIVSEFESRYSSLTDIPSSGQNYYDFVLTIAPDLSLKYTITDDIGG